MSMFRKNQQDYLVNIKIIKRRFDGNLVLGKKVYAIKNGLKANWNKPSI